MAIQDPGTYRKPWKVIFGSLSTYYFVVSHRLGKMPSPEPWNNISEWTETEIGEIY
jgi:hypothetical protein